MCAVDCDLYREIENNTDSQELHKDLNALMKCDYDKQMHFNPQKCFVMRIPPLRHTTRFNYIPGHFGNSVYPALPVSFGGDSKSRRSLLSGVYASRSKRSHQSALEMCNLPWTPHSSLGKDTSCVSPKIGCLEYT